MIELTIPMDVREFLTRLDAFIQEEVKPAEDGLRDADITSGAIESDLLPLLRARAREAGVYAPQLPPEWGGQGLGVTALALVAERCGPHRLASLALNVMAPDEANLHLLLHYGSPEQQERWLHPLAEGTIRSCFGMTEPDAGSDPRRITTTAAQLSTGAWRLNGRKVFTTGAIGAEFCIVMAVSELDAKPGAGMSMFIVPTAAEGFNIVRDLETMGFHSIGGHPEIELTDVEVGPEAVLGELGTGFAMAQSRLGIGRLGHSMRWIGIAQAALDLATARALERETFGQPLSDRQAIQWWLADGATKLHASRLMVLEACWRIENGLEHRTQVAMVKTYVAEALGEIVDQALQVFGGWGYTEDYPFARWYRDARAARIYDGPSEVHRMFVARRVIREVEQTGTSRRTAGDVVLTTADLEAGRP